MVFEMVCIGYKSFCSRKLLVLIGILSLYGVRSLVGEDPGYDLLFTTNLQEFEDLPIHFTPPLPEWIQGSLIRNGMARFELGSRKVIHLFDGFAKLYKWNFHGNQTTFTTKFIQSNFYNDSQKEQTVAPYLLIDRTVPGYDEFQRLEQMSRGLDNMNVNVDQVQGRNGSKAYVALSDIWPVYQFDSVSLDTIKKINADINGETLSQNQLSSAHILPEKGTTNFFTTLGQMSIVPFLKSDLSVVRMKTAEEREILVTIKVDHIPYLHSFSVTENYVILFAPPFYPNVAKLIETGEVLKAMEYYPEKDTDIYVINIKTREVIKLSTPNVFFYHHINAFESAKGELVVDISTFKDPSLMDTFLLDTFRNATLRNKLVYNPQLKRYVINVAGRTVTPSVFPATKGAEFVNSLDLPAINENYRFENYCFVYGWTTKIDKTNYSKSAVVKKNLCKGGEDLFWHEKYQYPIEPFFVGRPNAVEEDDGVLLVPVLDGPRNQSYLAVLDAKGMELISKAYMPTAVPISFHGRFFSDSQINPLPNDASSRQHW